ncbi:MAG: hypothetical protein LBR47_07290, partial [Spirochaetaceae bacterium]|nr:hypothetical protein [Spirochaetaceae bacterium]
MQIIVCNIILSALFLGSYFLISLTVGMLPLFSLVVFLLCMSAIMIFCFAVSHCSAKVSSFKQFSLKELFVTVPKMWKPGLLFGVICGGGIIVLIVGISFYLDMNSLFGIF